MEVYDILKHDSDTVGDSWTCNEVFRVYEKSPIEFKSEFTGYEVPEKLSVYNHYIYNPYSNYIVNVPDAELKLSLTSEIDNTIFKDGKDVYIDPEYRGTNYKVSIIAYLQEKL